MGSCGAQESERVGLQLDARYAVTGMDRNQIIAYLLVGNEDDVLIALHERLIHGVPGVKGNHLRGRTLHRVSLPIGDAIPRAQILYLDI